MSGEWLAKQEREVALMVKFVKLSLELRQEGKCASLSTLIPLEMSDSKETAPGDVPPKSLEVNFPAESKPRHHGYKMRPQLPAQQPQTDASVHQCAEIITNMVSVSHNATFAVSDIYQQLDFYIFDFI